MCLSLQHFTLMASKTFTQGLAGVFILTEEGRLEQSCEFSAEPDTVTTYSIINTNTTDFLSIKQSYFFTFQLPIGYNQICVIINILVL